MAKHPENTQFNGQTVDWYDASTGKILDYEKAYAGLKDVNGFDGKLSSAMQEASAIYNKAVDGVKGT